MLHHAKMHRRIRIDPHTGHFAPRLDDQRAQQIFQTRPIQFLNPRG